MPNPSAGGALQPSADQNISGTWDFTPAPTFRGSEVPVTTTATQTLTNKTITSPTILAAIANLKITEYASDGAIAVESGIAVLTKTSAGAYTLAAPSVAGQVLILVAGTSFAHVVTGTNLFWAGETGGPFNKVTTAAFIGSGAILVGWNGLWLVVSDQIATIGD
jgi:hypothetical protein